ncbi:MAG: GAF domain-containing protein [Chloroflexi bacterium]|nr:MAG: GAF domain-containing protein [Chloroflexota bacterium]
MSEPSENTADKQDEILDTPASQATLRRLSREIKEISTLYNIGVVVGSSLELKDVIWGLYKESGRLINTDNFSIIIYDPPTQTLNFVLNFDQGKKMSNRTLKLSKTRAGLLQDILTGQKPVLLSDIKDPAELDGFKPFRSDMPIRSWLAAPIVNTALPSDSTQGIIAVWSYSPNAFGDHDLWLLSAIGTQAAIAIRNARLYESSRRRAAEMALLNEVARSLSSTLQLDEVLTRIMKQVEAMLNVEAGSLLLTDPATGDLVFQIALGEKADQVKPFRVPRGQGIAGEVAATGKPLIVANAAKDSRHFKAVDRKTGFTTRNMLCVPMVLFDKTIGVLQVINKKNGSFTQSDLELLSSIASYAAIAIQNARLHENVLAERDRVIAAEEVARKKLARDLHDGPVQLIAGLNMSLDFCRKALDKDPSLVAKELEYMQELAAKASHQMRTLLFELRPLVLETQGLAAAIRVFIDRRQKDIDQAARLSFEIETPNPDGELSRLDEKTEAAIFAIVQETVNNAIKHAEAQNITVRLVETPTALYATVTDDGKGFDVEEVLKNYGHRGSLGMVNIRERTELIGGDLSIKSEAGKGTRITVSVPKDPEARLRKRRQTGPLAYPAELRPDA